MNVTEHIIREGARKEVEWGIEHYGEKHYAEDLWGRIVDSKVTLFHGTGDYVLEDISRHGLQLGLGGYPEEEITELSEEEKPVPSIWFAYTPYLAFFFGDALVQVTIPVSWVTEANDGVYVEQPIPVTMIDRFLNIENWK